MKIKIISLVLCALFLLSILPGATTATKTIPNDISTKKSQPMFRDNITLTKVTDADAVCDLGTNYVVYGEGSTLFLYNIQTAQTANIAVGGSIVYPKISGDKVVFYDFAYTGFKLYNITTGETTKLLITNWPGGDSDDFQFAGDYLVFQNYTLDIYATEIYLYTLSSGQSIRLTDTPGDNFPENPVIFDNIVAWQLTKGAQADIIMYDIPSSTFTNVTHVSQFESDTYPSIYEQNILFSYFYYDKPNGTRLYGLKMYNITTQDETTLLTSGEPTAGTPELYANIIVYSNAADRLIFYNYTTNFTLTLYEGIFLTTPWNINENFVLFTILGGGAYLYRYTPTPPVLEITIKGGLGVAATIKNIGATNLTNISYSFALDGKLIFLGKDKTGTIESLAAGESKTIRDFVIGFGKTGILVTAGTATQNTTGTVLFVFVLGVK